MKNVIRVRCEKGGADSRVFTDGKVYEARHHANALYEVRDDRGNVRYIIPGERCPHLVVQHDHWQQAVVGRFVVLEEAVG